MSKIYCKINFAEADGREWTAYYSRPCKNPGTERDQDRALESVKRDAKDVIGPFTKIKSVGVKAGRPWDGAFEPGGCSTFVEGGTKTRTGIICCVAEDGQNRAAICMENGKITSVSDDF